MEDRILIGYMQEQTKALAAVEQKVGDMHARLFGNGQPGALTFLDSRIHALDVKVDSVQEQQADYYSTVGLLKWRLGTLSALAGSVLSLAIQWFITKFMYKG